MSQKIRDVDLPKACIISLIPMILSKIKLSPVLLPLPRFVYCASVLSAGLLVILQELKGRKEYLCCCLIAHAGL